MLYTIMSISMTKQSIKYGLILIAAGGLSNGVDRVIHGSIIDVARIGNLTLNMADIYIVIGAIVIMKGIWEKDKALAKD